jgi:integrase
VHPLFINESELSSIIGNTKDDILKELFTLAFYTGMRLGEIVNLRWSNVDFEDKVIQVRNENGFRIKNKKIE